MHTRLLLHLLAAKVAVLSAKEHSPNLIPILLYGGSSGEASAAAQENILWFREQGGIVYHHNLTFMSNLQVSKFAARHAHLTTKPGHKDLLRSHNTSKHACMHACIWSMHASVDKAGSYASEAMVHCYIRLAFVCYLCTS